MSDECGVWREAELVIGGLTVYSLGQSRLNIAFGDVQLPIDDPTLPRTLTPIKLKNREVDFLLSNQQH